MSDDEGSSQRVPREGLTGTADPENAALPDHASAYYSPRLPPVETSHDTMEIVSVKLAASADPRLADTQRVSVDGLQPPPWLAAPAGPQSDAPTVLLPIVRKRRIRNRVVAGIAAAVVGAAFGVWFELDTPVAPPPVAANATNAAPLPAERTPNVIAPTFPTALKEQAVPVPAAPASAAPSSRAPVARLHAGTTGAAPSAGAWFKAEPPKPWLK